MRIALDYDETITRDPGLWAEFVGACRRRMHEVVIVTMRYDTEPVRHDFGCKVIYTGRQLKKPFAAKQCQWFDVWIDDQPDMINGGGTILRFDDAEGQGR